MNNPTVNRKRTREEVEGSPSHSNSLRSSPPKRVRKAATVINISIPDVKRKAVLPGRGTPLKDIPNIEKVLREAYKQKRYYHLSVLHNLMYGFQGKERSRLKTILNFSGYPKGITREAKLRQLYGNTVYSWARCYYVRLILTWFGLSTEGNREELYQRFLDFMFHPKA